MRILFTALFIMFAVPAMACEGFNNSMDALEHAMGINQPAKPQTLQTKKPVQKTVKAQSETNPKPKTPPVTSRNTL